MERFSGNYIDCYEKVISVPDFGGGRMRAGGF